MVLMYLYPSFFNGFSRYPKAEKWCNSSVTWCNGKGSEFRRIMYSFEKIFAETFIK